MRRLGLAVIGSLSLVAGAGCGGDRVGPSADEWGGEPLPEWRCGGGTSPIVGSDHEPVWVVPESIAGGITTWTLEGRERDATLQLAAGSGPEHEGPCATAEGDLVGIALPLGPTTASLESETHLFVGMNDGPRAYDVATEFADSEAPTIDVQCGLYEGGYLTSLPSSGTIEVTGMPSPDAPLTIVGHTEGDCTADFDLALTFPPELFEP